jgi:putative transposase
LTFHVIFITKFRKKCLSKSILQHLYNFLPIYCEKIVLKILEIKGKSDHIHFLLETKPTDKISNIIGILKSTSTKHIYNLGFILPYYGKLSSTLWSSGYFVCSTGGVTIKTLEKYIQNQKG